MKLAEFIKDLTELADSWADAVDIEGEELYDMSESDQVYAECAGRLRDLVRRYKDEVS